MPETKARFLADTQKADTTAEAFTMPTGRASQANHVLAMTNTSTGETGWQVTATPPTITSVSGLLNDDSDSTLTLVGSDFTATTTVKLFDSASGGNEVAGATVNTSGFPTKLVATFGHANLTKNATLYVEANNQGMVIRHGTGITVNGDPIGAGSTSSDWFSNASGANHDNSTHLGTYGTTIVPGNDSNTEVLLNFDKGGGTTITNSASGGSHSVTVNGDAKIKASPYGDGKSAIYFSSGNDQINVAASNDFNLERTSTFTIDLWFYRGSSDSYQRIISQDTGSSTNGWALTTSGGGQLEFGVDDDIKAVSTTNNPLNTWHYIRVTGDGSNIRFYIDGVLDKTEAVADIVNFNQTNKGLVIGSRSNDTYDLNNGFIDELRLINGTALSTGSTHDVPTTRFTGNETNTKLLIRSGITFDEVNTNSHPTKGGTGSCSEVVAGSTGTVESHGHAKRVLKFVDTSSTNNAKYDIPIGNIGLGTNDNWMVDFWVKTESTDNSDNWIWQIAPKRSLGGATLFGFREDGSTSSTQGGIDVRWDSDYAIDTGTGFGANNTDWQHWAVSRDGTNLRLYKNADYVTKDSSLSDFSALNVDDMTLRLGILGDHTLTTYFTDFRIVVGESIWTHETGTKTLMTSPYNLTDTVPSGQVGTSLLPANASNIKFLYTSSHNIKDSSSSPHTVTIAGAPYHTQDHGGIAPAMAYPNNLKTHASAGVYFDGTTDYLQLPDSSELRWDTSGNIGGSYSIDFWMYLSSLPTGTSGDNAFMLMFDGNDSASNSNFSFSLDAVNGLTWGGVTGGISQNEGNMNDWITNRWYHIAVTRNALTSFRVYRDGKMILEQTSGLSANSSDWYGIKIGGGTTSQMNAYDTLGFHGYLDSIRIQLGSASFSGNSTTTANFTLPTQIYGGDAGVKTIPTITFAGTATSPSLAGDEDLHFTEVENTSNATNQKKLSDLGLTIDNTFGNANQASLTGNLNLADNVQVNYLGVKVQVRKTLSNSAGTSGQATITFSSGTTTAGLSPDMIVTGTGINASETKITSVDSATQITVDNNHAGTVSGDLIFYDPDRVHFINKGGDSNVWDNPTSGGLSIKG